MASLRKMLKRDITEVVVDNLLYEVNMGSVVHNELKSIYLEAMKQPSNQKGNEKNVRRTT